MKNAVGGAGGKDYLLNTQSEKIYSRLILQSGQMMYQEEARKKG
jgi:hypothetical protein